MQSRETFIEVAGGRIWSEIIYTETSKHRPALICLHGGPGSNHNKLKYSLSGLAKFFPIIFYDQLGGGKSYVQEGNPANNHLWNVQRFTDELASLIQFYKLEQFNLFGSSWGSSLAIEYWLGNYNPKPQRLVLGSPLISTKIWEKDSTLLKQQLPAEIYSILVECEQHNQTSSQKYKDAMEQFYNRHVLRKPELNATQLDFLARNPTFINNDVYQNMWGCNEFYSTGQLANYERFADLQHISIPTLFIGGEHDEARPETLALYQQQVKDSQLVTIAGASHCGYFEATPAYSKALQEFLWVE